MSAPAALKRRRDYAGPALFAYGFRPFFLAAGFWGAFGILLWLPQYLGALTLPTHFGPLDWHIHEMLFGFVMAAVGGFLLTAIPNWAGRAPVALAPPAIADQAQIAAVCHGAVSPFPGWGDDRALRGRWPAPAWGAAGSAHPRSCHPARCGHRQPPAPARQR